MLYVPIAAVESIDHGFDVGPLVLVIFEVLQFVVIDQFRPVSTVVARV